MEPNSIAEDRITAGPSGLARNVPRGNPRYYFTIPRKPFRIKRRSTRREPMESRFPGRIQELPDARRLELLIDAVTDYAIYLLDVDGVVSRDHRATLFDILYG
jgi:hypothetical protein